MTEMPVSRSLLVALVSLAAVFGCGCSASKPVRPEYTQRVSSFGVPDVVADYSGKIPAYYSHKFAETHKAPAFEVYYYVGRNEQVAFQRGRPPETTPIPPGMRDFIRDQANYWHDLDGEPPLSSPPAGK